MPSGNFKSKYLLIKINSLIEMANPHTGVKKLLYNTHLNLIPLGNHQGYLVDICSTASIQNTYKCLMVG